ncbi:hypothetical protein TRVA0_036S00650 [Trichomonascus vanleenenianus]|uniref:uncharacterized protein n=1 Tax=Trichomonascus vanleenenianus TaxID=2268995 RepID=UPI003EC9CE8E
MDHQKQQPNTGTSTPDFDFASRIEGNDIYDSLGMSMSGITTDQSNASTTSAADLSDQQQQHRHQHQQQYGGVATTQPLWSLYPSDIANVASQVSQIPINHVSSPKEPPAAHSSAPASMEQVPTTSSVARYPRSSSQMHSHAAPQGAPVPPANGGDYLSFASESQNQRESLLRRCSEAATRSYDLPPTSYTSPPFGYGKPPQRIPHVNRPASTSRQENLSPRGYTTPPIHQYASVHSHTPEIEDYLYQQRTKYKARSSIPPDLSSSKYAEQCIAAAKSSRLPPFALHTEEYNLLRPHLPYVHVTTYLNIRNGILRLWLSNPMVSVTMAEAAGCARDERFYGLAEVAYNWLVRQGYINFGCVEHSAPESIYDPIPPEEKKPRLTVVVVGAGIAGLSCARQLDTLFRRYSHYFTEYQDIPRVIILEGRRRIGGRIYSMPLTTDNNCMVDVGAQLILGFRKGNPLAVLIRRQLGLPVVPIQPPTELYDGATGTKVHEDKEKMIESLFNHVLEKMDQFKAQVPNPNTAHGDEALMRAAKDPNTSRDEFQENQTIAKLEESGELSRPYEDPGEINDHKHDVEDPETRVELEFLRKTGFKVKSGKNAIHVAPEPQGDMHPNLGKTMDSMVRQLQEVSELTPEDIRLFNWFYANLEYSCGSNLDNMSLSSWNQDEGNEFAGRHSMIPTGYQSVTRGLYTLPEKLDVRFKTSVRVLEYGPDQCNIFLENGERISSDRVCMTVPLGVLKERSIQFIPDLPQWKTDSIERLGFGVMNKICLVFDEAFWDENKDIICVAQGPPYETTEQAEYKSRRGQLFMFWNITKVIGRPCLMGLITGEAAVHVANELDEEIVDHAKAVLAKVYPLSRLSKLVESVVTRWQIDPFSCGSYSYIGPEATGADYDLMARPINNSLFFAGEATCRSRPGTVHGAYISGLRAANEILTSIIGEVEIPHPLIPPKDYNRSTHVHSAPPTNNLLLNPTPQSHFSQQRPVRSNMASPAPHPLDNGGYYPPFDSRRPPLMRHDSNDYPIQVATGSSRPSKRKADAKSLKRKASALVEHHHSESEPSEPEHKKSLEEQLKELREKRVAEDNEKMRNDLVKELGERPIKPDRPGANPFLIFQKDFWEICRKDTDVAKRRSTGDPEAKATRNEVRAALGKMWRELPEASKQPYLAATQEIKESNSRNMEEYKKQQRRYEAEAEDFRRRWKEEHPSKPTEDEHRLMQLIQEQHDRESSRKKHH